MFRWAFLFIFSLLLGLLVIGGYDTVLSQESDSPYILADLSYEVYPTFSRVIIASNEKIDFVSYQLKDPYRIVVDLIGVCFCELEEHMDFREGLAKSIDIIEIPYVQRPEGLDEFFYAVDYVIISPLSKMPYNISTAEDGKIVVVDIGREKPPQIRVSKAKPLATPSEGPLPKEEQGLKEPTEAPGPTEIVEPVAQKAAQPPAITKKPVVTEQIDEPIIDYISYEVLDDTSLVIIASTKELEFEVSRKYYPRFGIILKPKRTVFTELEQKVRLDQGLVSSLQIIKDQTIKRPPMLDEYFYPIRYILIEPTDRLPVDFYSNEDATISVVEVSIPGPKPAIKAAEEELEAEELIPEEVAEEPEEVPEIKEIIPEEVIEQPKEEPEIRKAIPEEVLEEAEEELQAEEIIPEEVIKRAEQPPQVKVIPEVVIKKPEEEIKIKAIPVKEPEEEKPITRKEMVKELKEELKREELLRKEKLAEEERILKDAKQMADVFDKEVIRDLIVKGKGILSLVKTQEMAIKNSPTAKTAKEEVDLARMKVREAFRALFPQVKLKGSHTKGDVLEVDFIEKVYGVQAEQPIYQGGRLFNIYKQGKVNLKLAEARAQKIETDLDYKVAEAYYGAVTALMNLRLQQDLLREAEKILQIAQDRHNAGLSTKLEILNVKAQHNQTQFQLAAAKRDLALAKFKLQQAMNLDVSDEEIDLNQIDAGFQFKILEVDLETCLEKAYNNQPDILVNKLLLESNQYGEKIAKGKDNFKIDLTGFYGRSDSYYETEEEDMDKDWNIGVKVSRPFWGNIASYSFTKEETSRKVGQTDRTGSTVHSGEFAILDGVSIASEIKEARVNRQKAENDLLETKRQVALEVKEAYYSYQEAIIQVKNSLEKVKFQKEAVKVAKAQAELNEALQSQSLEAMIKLADERAVYIKALSDYNLALSKLNKAVGLKDYYSID